MSRPYLTYSFVEAKIHGCLRCLLLKIFRLSNCWTSIRGIPGLWGQKPCSSGYGWQFMFVRLEVRIPAPYTGWALGHFFTLICIVCLKKTKNKRKIGRGWPFLKKLLNKPFTKWTSPAPGTSRPCTRCGPFHPRWRRRCSSGSRRRPVCLKRDNDICSAVIRLVVCKCDQIGLFWNIFDRYFQTKVAQIFADFLNHCENCNFLS